MKVILSQGQGRLQLIQTSISLKKIGVDVRYITGWVPKNIPKGMVDFLGKLVGRNDLYKRLMVRKPKELADNEVISCSFTEFYLWFLIIIAKTPIISLDKALQLGWLFWGKSTVKHIENADVFHVRSGAGQGGAIAKAKKANMVVVADHSIAHPRSMKKYLIEEYNRFNQPYDMDPDSRFWGLVEQDCIDADYVVVNSDFVKQTFIDNGFLPEKVKVIYLGVREDFVAVKTNWAIAPAQPAHLLFIGSFGFRKGARLLIESVRILNERGANVVLDIIGPIDGIDVSDIPGNIKFHGSFVYEELINFLKISDIYVFPTFAEGSSRAVMEAMGAGIPVITTLNCGVPITHDVTGIIIPTNDSVQLANEVERLINNEPLRKSIGANASALIKENYTWDIYAETMKHFYKEISGN